MSADTPDLIQHPSPNFGPRRDGLRPELVVLHYTAMQDSEVALDRLCDPTAEVSAHYLIGADGRIWQMVEEEARAWHAGAGRWGGSDDVNSRSIGIELDNRGDHPFSAALMEALERLLPGIMQRWSIPLEGIIGHSDMAPMRKQDPGPRFDWQRLARQGLSIWPDQAGSPQGRGFDILCDAFGYDTDTPAEARLTAFRDRFNPGATGSVNPTDLSRLAALADRWPTRRDV